MTDFSETVKSAIQHKATVDTVINDIKDNKIMMDKLNNDLYNLIRENQTTEFSFEYLDKLLKNESDKFVKKLNGILDYGVKTIFFDRDYSIDIRVSDNSRATIHLLYDDENGNRVEPDIKNCGGGIRSVVGFLLQVFFIFQYNVEPILFLDESLSQVSSKYIPPLIELINELSEKNDLKILLITHDVRLQNLDSIKNRYEVKNGKIIEVSDENNSNQLEIQ